MTLKNPDFLKTVIISQALYNYHTIECACFLKCDDQGDSKVMKSECVTPAAPDAVSWDWRFHG